VTTILILISASVVAAKPPPLIPSCPPELQEDGDCPPPEWPSNEDESSVGSAGAAQVSTLLVSNFIRRNWDAGKCEIGEFDENIANRSSVTIEGVYVSPVDAPNIVENSLWKQEIGDDQDLAVEFLRMNNECLYDLRVNYRFDVGFKEYLLSGRVDLCDHLAQEREFESIFIFKNGFIRKTDQILAIRGDRTCPIIAR